MSKEGSKKPSPQRASVGSASGRGRKKIAILGTAPSWKRAPFDEIGWSIWVCNRYGLKKQKPWHRVFEIHKNWDYEDSYARDQYLQELAKVKAPQEVVSLIPLAGVIPRQNTPLSNNVPNWKALFEKYGRIWFSSSFGYMLALALEEEPDEIGLWGIDMESREEYVVQFAGVRHFLDLARSKGIKITVPPTSSLLREPPPYPDRFETVFAHDLEEKARDIEGRIAQAENAIETVQDALMERGRYTNLRTEDVDGREPPDLKATLRNWKRSLYRLQGMLMMLQNYKRRYVWNAVPPDLGDENEVDIFDCGPV